VTASAGGWVGGESVGPLGGEPLGTCCIVLHSHLPWLAHAGSWPVGEEWLYQAWAGSYLPVTDLLLRLAAEGRRNQLTLGVTPVLAAMLDDPYCLEQFRAWLANWQIRAEGAVVDGVPNAEAESRAAVTALRTLETRWSAGGSPVFRSLLDSGVAEILGGPGAHPFLPLLDERLARAALEAGLEDAAVRLGRRPRGIWAPECAYRPGLEQLYAAAGVTHFLVDGPTVDGETGAAYDVAGPDGAGSGVLAFPRDMEISYRVWSPTAGYPGGPWYRDFHTFDHPSGLKPSRVTGHDVPPEHKAAYDSAAAAAALATDVDDFVDAVVGRLTEHRTANGRPGLVVVAYDTELFGHWWHEGPAFLEAVLRRLPERGVRLSTLADAGRDVVAGPRRLPASSWGAGKDWHIWTDQADLTDQGARVADRLLGLVEKRFADDRSARDPRYDQLLREAFLTLSSDWAFLVSHGSSPDYAHRRAREHAARFDELADLLEADLTGRTADSGRSAAELAGRLRAGDGPFGRLDARTVLTDVVPGAIPAGSPRCRDAGEG
jgi:1,4-alpha-glucan branching enzyme